MSFEVVGNFEKKIADWFGAPHGVAVDCCTHGIELCLRQQNIQSITVPKRTYLSIPFLADKLGVELSKQQNDLTEKQKTEGLKIGLQVAKDLTDPDTTKEMPNMMDGV